MDKSYIDMHLLTDRYLQGSLTEGETEDFEERLVWDQELIDELDLAERLRDALKASVAEDRYSAGPGKAGLIGRFTGILAIPQYAAAASFALAVMLTAGVLLNPLMPDGDTGDLPTTNIVPLFVVRGASPAQEIQFNDASWTVLLVDVTGSHNAYRVTVRKAGADSEPVWMQDDLRPTYPESLAIGMPGNLLADGEYVLIVEGVVDTANGQAAYEHIQDIPFEAISR